MGLICSFSIAGAPRTKKTSQRIVQIKGKNGGRGFTKVLPSEQFEVWLDAAIEQSAGIRFQLQRAGVRLPISGPVAVRMLFFRDRLSGDLNGFEQAVTDALQTPLYRAQCQRCKELETAPNPIPGCQKCGFVLSKWKQVRKGMGIILDDKQVQSKDGSRLLKDSARPRVEIAISAFEEGTQEELALAGSAYEAW